MSTASELMDGEHRRPDHARVRAPARELDGGPLPERRKRPARRLGAGRVEEQLGGAREAPAEHQPLRLERVDDGRDADAEPAPIALEEGARLAVALACRLDRIAARATALLRDEPADRALRVALAAARRLALEAAAAAVPLERAGARQLVHRIRLLPGGAAIDHDVAQLGAETGGAAEDPPVDDQSAADAGAERQHRELARGRIGDQLRSAERSGTPASGMFTLASAVPLSASIWEGTPTPTAVRPPSRPAAASRATAAISSSSASSLVRSVGRSIRRPTSTPSTTAPATFVPPTSTPTTAPVKPPPPPPAGRPRAHRRGRRARRRGRPAASRRRRGAAASRRRSGPCRSPPA